MKDSILKGQATTNATTNSANEISKVSVSAIGISACAVGLWAVVCLSSAFVSEGGPVALAKSLFRAVTGSM